MGGQVQDDDFQQHRATTPYSRTIFEEIGGYQRLNGGEDQEFEGALRHGRNTKQHWNIVRLPLDRLFYIYRRCHGCYHASGVDDLRDIEPDVRQGRVLRETSLEGRLLQGSVEADWSDTCVPDRSGLTRLDQGEQ